MQRLYIADIRSNSSNNRLNGHCGAVARNYKELFHEVCDVKIVGGPIYKKYFNEEDLFLLPFDVPTANLLGKLKTIWNSIRLFWQAKGEIIVLQQCTVLTSYFCIALFYWWTSKLYLIDYNTSGHNRWWKHLLYYFVKYKINGVICPTKSVGEAYGRPYCIVTDYIKTNYTRIENIPFKKREYDFCIIGTIWPDKGVVEAARRLKGTGLRLIIAGAVAVNSLRSELEEIASEDDNVKLFLNYLSEDKYKEYVTHSKYCILNYSGGYNDRSSGVVLDVLFNRTPVIGNKCKALELVVNNGVGYVYNDIEKWDPVNVINEDLYNSYQLAIDKFFLKQKEYAHILRDFIMI